MKKISTLVILLFISLSSFAQEKGTNDLTFSLGLGTTNDFLKSTEDIISGVFGVETGNSTVGPSFNIAYKRAIMNNWFFFADGTYQTIKEDVLENSVKTGDVSNRYLTVGFGTEYHYVHKAWFQMYSGASIAYTSQNADFTTSSDIEDTNDSYFNFQVNAVGLRFGKALGGFVELGVGYRGYVNAGLSYQF